MHGSPTALKYGTLGLALGRIQHWWYRATGKHHYDRLAIEWVHGTPLLVMPTVFNPRTLRTGAFFAHSLADGRLTRDRAVLDMGTGSGVCAIAAARHARRVVAVDINRNAVRCARANALMNQLEDRVEVFHGDLYEPLGAERFDLILFNPPFLKGVPKSERDCAWRSPDAIERFAAGLDARLEPGGAALVLLSTWGDSTAFLGEFERHGFRVAPWAQKHFVNETLTIFRVDRG
jgi:HemK-related putative methylase